MIGCDVSQVTVVWPDMPSDCPTWPHITPSFSTGARCITQQLQQSSHRCHRLDMHTTEGLLWHKPCLEAQHPILGTKPIPAHQGFRPVWKDGIRYVSLELRNAVVLIFLMSSGKSLEAKGPVSGPDKPGEAGSLTAPGAGPLAA